MTMIRLSTSIGRATGVLLAAAITPAFGQDLGDAKRGQALATRVCGECHAVLADDAHSPNPKSTPFSLFAQVPGLTERALVAFLQTPHKDMPNFVLTRQEQDDVIAYIMALRPKR